MYLIIYFLAPEWVEVYFYIGNPYPHPPLERETGQVEHQHHRGQGGEGPGPGGGGHQVGQVEPGGDLVRAPGAGEHYRDRRDTVQWCYRVNQWRGL